MANSYYSPDSGPSSHLSVAIIGKHGVIPKAAWPGAAARSGVVSIAPSTTANPHN